MLDLSNFISFANETKDKQMKPSQKLILFIISLAHSILFAQNASIKGQLIAEADQNGSVKITLNSSVDSTTSDHLGFYRFENLEPGIYQLKAEMEGFENINKTVVLKPNEIKTENFNFQKKEKTSEVDEVAISGTLKPVKRLDSPVPVEIYNATFFKKNPSPSLFDALQNINGVRPQLNCNICSTGDIHINGLEGPYTMVLIDGMPIVSALGSVYGLSGIPNSLIERVEVVKGPASSLYGSEAVGGLINIITKKPGNKNNISTDIMATSWGEYNVDLGFQFKFNKKINVLTGVNYFNFQNIYDKNNDRFTDVTLQDRISIFQKWNFERKENRLFSLAARYSYEDRWGGDVRWNKSYRGGNKIYGESIYTNRVEVLGNYQLPTNEKLFWGFSIINHLQDSRYGTTVFDADQKIVFNQITWDKTIGKHDLLGGAALRYSYYDDNSPATASINFENQPEKTWLPGIFIQDEIKLNPNHQFLLGARYDYNNHHGSIFTPRLAYKWKFNQNMIRLNAGTGFRVVNLFTEDHAALTGSRDVLILEDLKPEKSYNLNLNYVRKVQLGAGSSINLDATVFYTYFNNKIVPDYSTDPNKIIYTNLSGHAESKGLSVNLDLNWNCGIKLILGATWMDNTITEGKEKRRPLLTEKFTGTWTASYKIFAINTTVDYTGNLYSPMQLPLLGKLDPRPEFSPWWSVQNIQFTYNGFKNFEVYGGIKNILNWTPAKVKNTDFIIARSEDPFDQNVNYDAQGQIVSTPLNPYALSFDPSYVYASNQGIRFFFGFRYHFK